MNVNIIDNEAKWVLAELASAYRDKSENNRNYYQGRVDQLAWVKGQLIKEGVIK